MSRARKVRRDAAVPSAGAVAEHEGNEARPIVAPGAGGCLDDDPKAPAAQPNATRAEHDSPSASIMTKRYRSSRLLRGKFAERYFAKLSEVVGTKVTDLDVAWRTYLQSEPPLVPVGLLAHGIAWAHQAGAEPELAARVETALRRLSQSEDPITLLRDGDDKLHPGSTLSRDWEGVVETVVVSDLGFLYGNEIFETLDEAVCRITGRRMSGSDFFGLLGDGGGND